MSHIKYTHSEWIGGIIDDTKWQRPLYGVHSITMEKLDHAGEGGGARPPPYTISTIAYKVVV